jgi:uracil-DNA glycosylase
MSVGQGAGRRQTGEGRRGSIVRPSRTRPEAPLPETLVELEHRALGCTLCPLSQTRTQVVFGTGDPHADLMFVGEAPGFHEDQQGEPFVGAAGNLLTRMIEGIGRRRSDVYIANVLKCRPPGNRDPEPVEIASCRPFLEGQIDNIDPTVVVALGNFAARLLLDTKEGITRLRGREHSWRDCILIPTYHPAAVLRGRGEALAQMRADFVLIKRALQRLAPAEGVRA